ncbi:hypothetical protein ACFYVR_16945 [Rhodococcus sp. NPDC003318]|uniref:hypothetical protein n=1 Tax=Rhodococcus sp. NPDC003318 TaxID=3364503 RepID=UPI0036BBD8ED
MPQLVVDFDSVADELYGLEPSEFVAARRAAVARAREAGDKALARELGALRKPTTTGWALNALVRADPDGVDRLLDLGAALRAAQQALRADELRSLAQRRGAELSALTERTAEVAAARGHAVTESVLREVGQSLSAALADPDIGADLRRGRMLGAVSYSGFGPAVLAAVPTPPEADTDREPPPAHPVDDAGRAEARAVDDAAAREARAQAERAARSRLSAAEDAARTAAADLDAATERAETAVRRAEELRDELSRAEQEGRFADSARRSAEETARRAAAELGRARDHAAEFDA